MSIIPSNALRAKLADGRLAVGCMVALVRQPTVMQLLANAGFDWCIIDNEHGTFSVESVGELSRMARLLGITPIVRVPALTYEAISQSLDGGAQGVMLPRITTAAEVAAAVAVVKYPPEGRRGSAAGRGHTDFRAGDIVTMMADSNRETFVVVQIETREAVERLDEILAVPGVDAALIGPNDLSIALGVPGRMRDPVLEGAIERMLEACARHGVVPAIHTNDVGLTAEWGRRGMRLVSISTEANFLQFGGKAAVDAIRAPA
ncbi:MAG: HpcH/HpaI aldolase/citrate lyase family protein [Gemmatimonadales bacterium]